MLRWLAPAAAVIFVASCTGRWAAPALPARPAALHALSAPKALYVANRWGSSIYVYQPDSPVPSRKITQGLDGPFTLAEDASGNLFAANGGSGRRSKGSVTVYAPGSNTPARRITDGLGDLNTMAVDAAGDVFAANRSSYEVYEYAAGTTKISHTITAGIEAPVALAADSAGYLYVSNCQHCLYPVTHDTLTIYSPKTFKLLHTITTSWRRQPGQLGFDRSGDLYVDMGGDIDVYAPHGTKVLRTIDGAAGAFCFDASGNLYSGQAKYVNSGGRVLVYRPNEMTPAYTITQGIADPASLATDAGDDLYVANPARNNIVAYEPGKKTPLRTIIVATGLDFPQALALDGENNLYAANQYESSITVYPPGSSEVLRTIYDGIASPSALAFDRSGNLYVVNYYGTGGSATGFVTVYEPGSSQPWRKIAKDIHGPGYAVAFDAAGNLYVGSGCPNNSYPIAEFAAGKRTLLRMIGRSGICPSSMAFDASGNLYVAVVGLPGAVSVFPPGSSDPKYMITDGINYPDGLLFDSSGNLWVSNAYGGNGRRWGSISAYRPGAMHPFRQIRPLDGGHGPGDPLLGPSGDLYVVSGNEILAFAPAGNDKPVRIIRQGLRFPTSPVFDSDGNLYAANPAASNRSTVTEYAPGSDKVNRTYPPAKAYPESIVFGP
ncbi:MAG TPA: hypothetical protein VKR56_16100 [Candidatus Cybelea sp.]|nr:hypothetical protein [Candidatus Cybelea sp.]